MSIRNIKKGDIVEVLAGESKAKQGQILKLFKSDNKALVEGLNLRKRRIKPRRAGEKGQTVEVSMPIAISNLALVCKSCKKGRRIKVAEIKGKRTRICASCSKPF